MPPLPEEPSLQEKLDNKIAHLEEQTLVGTRQTPHTWRQTLSSIAIIVLIAGMAWSALVIFGWVSNPLLPKKQPTIYLAPSKQEQIVFLIERTDGGEVRLINTQTNSVKDISTGNTNVTSAALSPNGEEVAYTSYSQDGSSLYLVNVTGAITQVFPSSALKAAITSAASQSWQAPYICKWSGLYWSPDNNSLVFFGCDTGRSALFLTTTQAGATPVLIQNTENASDEIRQAVWSAKNQLVITSYEGESTSLILIDPLQQKDARLYGPLN